MDSSVCSSTAPEGAGHAHDGSCTEIYSGGTISSSHVMIVLLGFFGEQLILYAACLHQRVFCSMHRTAIFTLLLVVRLSPMKNSVQCVPYHLHSYLLCSLCHSQ